MDTPELNNPVTEDPVMQLVPPPITTPDSAPDETIAIGAPASSASLRNVSVYAENISPVAYDQDDPIAAFDVVFCVCIVNDMNAKTYKVVKRIGVDRMKMADDAATTTPISIVESKKPTNGIPTSRFKKLAGL